MLTKGPVCQTFWQLSLKFKHIFYQTFNQNFIQTSNHAKEVQVPLELCTKTRQRQSASEALTTFWWAPAKDKDKTPNYCRLMKLNLFSYPNSNLEEQWYSLYRYRYWCYTIQSIQKFNSLQKLKYFETRSLLRNPKNFVDKSKKFRQQIQFFLTNPKNFVNKSKFFFDKSKKFCWQIQ